MQLDAWERGEGNSWFQRNEAALADVQRITRDQTLAAVALLPIPQRVCEIGAANCWRLDIIRQWYACDCLGVDVSAEAIADAHARFFGIAAVIAPAHEVPARDASQDLVICSFVLHWVDRAYLARTVAEADRVLKPGGHLIISDFLPDAPCRTRYHHRQDVELWTYKQDYAACWFSLATYQELRRQVWNHDTGELGDCPAGQRAVTVTLRKEEIYSVATYSRT